MHVCLGVVTEHNGRFAQERELKWVWGMGEQIFVLHDVYKYYFLNTKWQIDNNFQVKVVLRSSVGYKINLEIQLNGKHSS
jgi:hypothetical protein